MTVPCTELNFYTLYHRGDGVVVTPVGYIELKEAATRLRPIRSFTASVITVSGIVSWALLRGLPKLWQ